MFKTLVKKTFFCLIYLKDGFYRRPMISQKPLAFIAVNIPDHPLESMEDSCGEKDPQVIGVKLLTLTSHYGVV